MAEALNALVLEDVPADAELAVRELRKDGFEPIWTRVETEEEFIAHLTPAIDVILADFRMPQFDAERALALLNERAVQVPLIVVSGTIGEEAAVRIMQAGAADYLLKDRLGRLGQAVRRALERRRLRAEADIANERYRSIVENAVEGMFQATAEGNIVVANPAFMQIYGCETLPELKRAFPSMTSAMDGADAEALRGELDRSGEVRGFEARLRLGDGSTRWLSLNMHVRNGGGTAAFHEGTVQDVTRRKVAEAAVARSESRFKALFDSDAIGLFILDAAGRILEGNARFLSMLGYLQSDLPLSWLNLTLPEAVERERRAVNELDESGKVKPWEKAFLHADGHAVYCMVGGVRLAERAGLYFAVDMTEMKATQAKLEAAKKQVELTLDELKKTQDAVIARERLHALGQMASGIAHDFNNALSPIIGHTEMLLANPDRLDDRATLLRRLNTIYRASLDAVQTIKRMREFFRERDADEGFDTVDVAELTTQAIELLRPRWGDQAMAAGIQYRMHPALDSAEVSGNAAELREVLMNILINAFDAMPNGGDLFYSVKAASDGEVAITVTDSGVGMAPEVQAHCFEPFFTTKGAAGTGLGLAMSYGIVKRHLGEIRLTSTSGEGTTVTISLPAAKPSAVARRDPVADRNSVFPIHVLLIDDDPDVRATIAEFLRLDGHHVHETDDPYRALRTLREGRFGAVITDRAMPQMSGDQVARQVKMLDPTMPVLMLTGFGEFMNAAEQRPEAVDILLAKPVTMAQLRTALRSVTLPAASKPAG